MAFIRSLFGKRPRELQGFESRPLPQLRKINEYVYEVYKPTENPHSVEIVFVHGFQLEGSDEAHISTWMSRDGSELWLNWIPEDFSEARILTISYDAHRRRTDEQGRTDMYITRENMLQSLIGSEAQVGQSGCPVVLVGHCLGGVVIKELCLQAALQVRSREVLDKVNQRSQNFLDNLKGLFYYGTPHSGTVVAGMRTWFAKGPLLDLMTILNKEAVRRSEEFCALRRAWGWSAFGVGEGLETNYGTFKGMMVEEASARSGVDSFYTDRSAHHFTISKAESRTSCTFLQLIEFLALVVNKEKVPTPSLLPFVADDKYVPIDGSVSAVMKALKDERRVILWGPPGMGKTSLLKYLALFYENQRKSLTAASSSSKIQFPDGVVYLNCGRKAKRRLTNLQQDLLQQLRSLQLVGSSSTRAQTPEMEVFTPESFRAKLMASLRDKILLIVMDNVWEPNVAEQFLVPNEGVRFLIASQSIRCIYMEAKAIQMAVPSKEEARKILANYTEGFPRKGEFPPHLQEVVDAITKTLQYHALSIANIGMAVKSEATSSSQWESIRENLFLHLEIDADLQRPSLYEAHYSFPMSVSMTMMLRSLGDEHRELLYLMALLFSGEQEARTLVKYFYGFVERNSSTFKYQKFEKLLADTSLIEIREDANLISTHPLRMLYIRKQNCRAVGHIASRILHVSWDEGRIKLIRRGDAEETLVTILSTKHFDDSFAGIAASSLETHIKILKGGVPRSLDIRNYVLDVVESIRGGRWGLGQLEALLSTDLGDGEWKSCLYECLGIIDCGDGDWCQEARECAKKIIIRRVCQGKLDDGSMGRLLAMKQTGAVACGTLRLLLSELTDEEQRRGELCGTALRAYDEILRALFSVLSDSSTSSATLKKASGFLEAAIKRYSKDALLWVPKLWTELLAMDDSHPDLPFLIADVLSNRPCPGQGRITVAEFPGLLEALVALLFSETNSGSGRDCALQDVLGYTLIYLCNWRRLAARIADIPRILKVLFSLFVSENTDPRIGSIAGAMLDSLICIPEKRIEFFQIEGGLEALAHIVAKMRGAWEVTDEKNAYEGLEKRASLAARIVGELALEEELRETIGRLPGLQEGLLFLQLLEMARLLKEGPFHDHRGCSYNPVWCSSNEPKWYYALNSTKALTILYSHSADPRVTEVPLGQVLELFPTNNCAPFEPTAAAVKQFYASIYIIRGTAQIEMRAYDAALMNIDQAIHRLEQVLSKVHGGYCLSVFPHRVYTCLLHKIRHLHVVHSVGGYGDIEVRSRGGYLYSSSNNESRSRQRPMAILRDCQIFLQTMLKKYDAALLGANERVELAVLEYFDLRQHLWRKSELKVNRFSALTERGVLKTLSGDWQGALDDFNEAMEFVHDGEDAYDAFKHRGYVKYLLRDEAGSQIDGASAWKVKPAEQTKDYSTFWRLRRLPVTYLGYAL